MVQALLTSEAGQDGIMQGLQQALVDKPELKNALNQLLNGKNGQQ